MTYFSEIMVKFTKESIQRLRDAVDIVDVVSRVVPLKRAGAHYKGLCPFHAEKSPSFTVNKASRHYHCFGCGAHGDAVSFLMQQEGFTFTQSLEFLSERFNIQLEEDRSVDSKGFDSSKEFETKKARLKQINELAKQYYHTLLLFSDEAEEAREYLIQRNIPLSFVQAFQIGYAGGSGYEKGDEIPLKRYLAKEGFLESELIDAGLIASNKETGRTREFFAQRVTFPILDHMGTCIGFSARKIRDETYGGKYVNTPETPLFKKSKILFGLPYCKKRIVRERVAILVEGQLDALRLIHSGFDYTIATLGTAFGEQHVDVIKTLGVERVYLVFDTDAAGMASIRKAGDLLMKRGIGVCVPQLYGAKDPDEFLLKFGRSQFAQLLSDAPEYVDFIISYLKKTINWSSPNEKDKALREFAIEIKAWENPILVHESLKKAAYLSEVPVELLGGDTVKGKELDKKSQGASFQFAASFMPLKASHSQSQKSASSNGVEVTIDIELELDLIRWLALMGGEAPQIASVACSVLHEDEFSTVVGKEMFRAFCQLLPTQKGKRATIELLDIASEVDSIENVEGYISYMISRPPIRIERSKQYVYEAIRKIKERSWIRRREAIRKRIVEEGPSLSDEEQLNLARQFAQVRPPELPPIEELFVEEKR